MQNHGDHIAAGKRPDFGQLFERLTTQGREWAEAEVSLARLELAELKSQALKAAGLAAIALGALICVMIALMQAGIAALLPHVPAPGLAGLIVAIVFALIAAGCGIAAWTAVSWRTESVFFRWLGSHPHDAP